MAKGLPPGWKILSSEYLHREDWLTVRQEKLELPGGHVIPKYFVLEYPDWVNTIAITDEGKYLLIRQYRHGLGSTAYELCAGVVDPGEDPAEAAKRELLEETGYGGGRWEKLMTVSTNPATSTNWVHCFIARGVVRQHDQQLEPSEQITTHLVDGDELRRMMEDGSIVQSLHLCPLWRFFAAGLDRVTSKQT